MLLTISAVAHQTKVFAWMSLQNRLADLESRRLKYDAERRKLVNEAARAAGATIATVSTSGQGSSRAELMKDHAYGESADGHQKVVSVDVSLGTGSGGQLAQLQEDAAAASCESVGLTGGGQGGGGSRRHQQGKRMAGLS
jgi:hypothetical protein